MMRLYATLGPACADQACLKAMLEEGLSGIRLNLAHGGLTECAPWLDLWQGACQAAGVTGELVIDLRGASLRVGGLAAPLSLQAGEEIPLGPGGLGLPSWCLAALEPGQTLEVDDGALLLRVLPGVPLQAAVVRGGLLKPHKGVAVAHGLALAPVLCEADHLALAQAPAYGVTGIMMPFARSGEGVAAVRQAMAKAGAGELKLFAKVEDPLGVGHIGEIAPLADEVVIARGDLGMRVPLWELPSIQRQLARACRALGRHFMVVTQLLHSMIASPTPTRAEVSDIAQAVWQGAASLMLTGETAVGAYPLQALRMLARTVRAAQG